MLVAIRYRTSNLIRKSVLDRRQSAHEETLNTKYARGTCERNRRTSFNPGDHQVYTTAVLNI